MSITNLISYEVLGAKEEFAGWVSNISPYDTPFTSLTGKARVYNKVFEWQTDRLEVVQNNAWNESRELLPAPTLITTQLHNNYTQIFRKVVNVSDTAEALVAHGRQSELEYQIEKATKEIKRDLEWTFLSSQDKMEGDASVPRKMSGFYNLVAGTNEVEPTTGAITHKRLATTEFTEDDIFDITYNLYIAGARANVIMFHPNHAHLFNKFFNGAENQRVSMYTNTDHEVPNSLTEIVDPWGQKFILFPNRYMGKGILYFFHPHDWFQRILRAPAISSLDKTGSNESWMLEFELGLQHRNPWASGILEMSDYTGGIEYAIDINPQEDITTNTKTVQMTYTANQSPKTVTWSSNNESVATVDQNGLVTVVGYGDVSISLSATFPFDVTKTSVVTFKVFGVKAVLASASTNYPNTAGVGVTFETNVPGGMPAVSNISAGSTPSGLVGMDTTKTHVTILKPGAGNVDFSVVFPAPYGTLTYSTPIEISGFLVVPNVFNTVLGTDFVIPKEDLIVYPDTLNPSGKFVFTVGNIGDDDYAGIVESGDATSGWVYTIKPKIGTSTAPIVHPASYKVALSDAPTKAAYINIKVTGTHTFVIKPHLGTVHVGTPEQLETETSAGAIATTTTWTSSNTANATVSATGEVTGVKAGPVTIIAVREFDNGEKLSSQIRLTIQ